MIIIAPAQLIKLFIENPIKTNAMWATDE